MFLPFEDFSMLRNFTSRIEQLKFQDDRCVRISICTRPVVVLQGWGEFMGSFGASNSKVSDESNLYIEWNGYI